MSDTLSAPLARQRRPPGSTRRLPLDTVKKELALSLSLSLAILVPSKTTAFLAPQLPAPCPDPSPARRRRNHPDHPQGPRCCQFRRSSKKPWATTSHGIERYIKHNPNTKKKNCTARHQPKTRPPARSIVPTEFLLNTAEHRSASRTQGITSTFFLPTAPTRRRHHARRSPGSTTVVVDTIRDPTRR